ncbi:MAG TPA: hypothetical protein PLD10_14195 [Rhodopila sp.]|nr:hypothetical protein [Rhodopila sp.]
MSHPHHHTNPEAHAAAITEQVAAAEAETPVAVEAPAVEAKPRAPRRRVAYDTSTGTITVSEPEKETISFSMSDIPEAHLQQLAMLGAWSMVRPHTDMAAAWAKLKAGEIGALRERGGDGESDGLTDWQQAIVNALMAESDMDVDQAKGHVLRMTRAQLAKARSMPAVQQEHAKLKPAAATTVASLLGG